MSEQATAFIHDEHAAEGMMMARQSAPLVNLPQLFWNEQAEIERLQGERELLRHRIFLLRPHCHRRVELEARLRDLTVRQLVLTTKIGGSA